MRVILLILLSILIQSCGNNVPIDRESSRSLPFEGYLHGDTKNLSNSTIEYNQRQYLVGEQSTVNIENTVQNVSTGIQQASAVQNYGTVNIIRVEFDGIIEEGSPPKIHVYKLLVK